MTSRSVSDAQAYCTALTKKSGSNFYIPSSSPKKRRAAMYSLCLRKEVDNAVDEPPQEATPGGAAGGGPSLKRSPRHTDLPRDHQFANHEATVFPGLFRRAD
jgi:hypothetical protein